jgi:hypothetical protein
MRCLSEAFLPTSRSVLLKAHSQPLLSFRFLRILLIAGVFVLCACGTEAPSGSPPDPIDQQFDALQTGHVAYQLPTSLAQNAPFHAIARISKALPSDITTNLQLPLTHVAPIKVSDQMKADLIPDSDGLKVEAIGEETQLVGERDWSQWNWWVTGVSPGFHHLSLVLTVYLPSGTKQLPIFDTDVQVVTTAPIVLASLYSTYGGPLVNTLLGFVLTGGTVIPAVVAWSRRRAAELRSSRRLRRALLYGGVGFVATAVVSLLACLILSRSIGAQSTASQSVSTLSKPVASSVLDPRQLVLPSGPFGFVMTTDASVAEHGWKGWERYYKSGSAEPDIYYVTYTTFVLPTGADPGSALKVAECDFTFPTPASSKADETTVKGAVLCEYTFANTIGSWVEFQQVIHGVLIEVGIEVQTHDFRVAENVLYQYASDQIVYVENMTA